MKFDFLKRSKKSKERKKTEVCSEGMGRRHSVCCNRRYHHKMAVS
jgi:hypothetical protein